MRHFFSGAAFTTGAVSVRRREAPSKREPAPREFMREEYLYISAQGIGK
jgi:hypothetical protein